MTAPPEENYVRHVTKNDQKPPVFLLQFCLLVICANMLDLMCHPRGNRIFLLSFLIKESLTSIKKCI